MKYLNFLRGMIPFKKAVELEVKWRIKNSYFKSLIFNQFKENSQFHILVAEKIEFLNSGINLKITVFSFTSIIYVKFLLIKFPICHAIHQNRHYFIFPKTLCF